MATATRKLVLDTPLVNSVENSRLVRSARGPQRHVQRDGEPRTLCAIDPTSWSEMKVENDELVTCPICARLMTERNAEPATEEPAATAAKVDEPVEETAKERRNRKARERRAAKKTAA